MDNLKRKMAIGVMWTTLFKLARRGLGLISTLILARLLVPADFGLVALATTIVAAFELMTAFNFEIALIQNQSAERKHYDTAWTFNVIFGLVIATILVLISGIAGEFFREPRLSPVLVVLAISFAIQSFSNIAVVDLQKELRFAEDFSLRAKQHVARFLVTVPMAIWLQTYWALIVGMLVGNIVKVVVTYRAVPYRPALSLAAGRELIGFSSWLLANRMLAFLRNRATELFLGRLAGVQALGLFTVGFEISNLPTTELVAPINRAVMPGYSKMASDLGRLRESYLEVIGLIALFAFPAGMGIAATAHLLVPVLLGDKWLAAIPVIQVLAVYGSLNALLANSAPMFNSLGKPHVITIIQASSIALLIPLAIYMAGIDGALGLAWSYLAIVPVSIVLTLIFAMKMLAMRLGEVVRVLYRPVVATIIMYFVVSWAFPKAAEIPESMPVLIGTLFLSVLLGIVTFVVILLVLWQSAGAPAAAESAIWSRVRRRLPFRDKTSR